MASLTVWEAARMLPEKYLNFWVDASGHWVWDGPVNKWGYAFMDGKNVAREIFTAMALGGQPFHRSKVLERRCPVAACVHPGHMRYQNRAALIAKQSGHLQPEQHGRGCVHEGVCERCGCSRCAG